jgi:tetratricopeptide (TPR) repeat protein
MHMPARSFPRFLQRLACAGLVTAGLAIGHAAAQGAPPPPAMPSEDAARRTQLIDNLFARLKTVKSQEDGDEIVAQIWKLWQQSGSPELDAAMQHAVLVMGQVPALAMPILDDIVARAPNWAEGWNKRATVLYLMGEYDRSLADIDRVLALEPRHFGALAGMGLIRIEKGETREALAAFRRALAVNPFLRERFGIIPALEKELGEKPI